MYISTYSAHHLPLTDEHDITLLFLFVKVRNNATSQPPSERKMEDNTQRFEYALVMPNSLLCNDLSFFRVTRAHYFALDGCTSSANTSGIFDREVVESDGAPEKAA